METWVGFLDGSQLWRNCVTQPQWVPSVKNGLKNGVSFFFQCISLLSTAREVVKAGRRLRMQMVSKQSVLTSFSLNFFCIFFLTVLILLRISLQNEEYFDIKWYVTYTSALDFGVCILGWYICSGLVKHESLLKCRTFMYVDAESTSLWYRNIQRAKWIKSQLLPTRL